MQAKPRLGRRGSWRPPSGAAPVVTVAGTFQGILGARPPAPAAPAYPQAHPATTTATPSPQWDQAALITALNQMSLHPPTTPGGDWIFDSGASSHMGFGSGISFTPTNPSSPSSIDVGNGALLPITGVGSTSFPTPSRPLSLLEILISPSLIKKLISVRVFTRDNSVSVEFDPHGFSIKDLATRTVLL